MATNNIHAISFGSPSDSKPTTSSFNSKALKACRPIIKAMLPKCFIFLDSFDDILFKLADKAKSDQQQEEYFVAMRQFRINQPQLKKEFTKLVLADYDDFCSNIKKQAASQNNSFSEPNVELAILGNKALEEDIAVNRIAMKCQSLFSPDINNLNIRLAYALNVKKINGSPLDPEHIAENFKKVIAPLMQNIEIKLLAYKQLEKVAVIEIGNLYKQMNNILIRQGVLPKISSQKINSQPSAAPEATSASEPAPDAVNNFANLDLTNDVNAGSESSYAFEDLRQSLNKHQGDQPNSNDQPTGPVVKHTTVLSALSNLQQRPTEQVSFDASGQAILPNVRQVLMDDLVVIEQDGTLTQPTIGHLDEDAMDLIDLLFKFILNDTAIPATIRALLARLQIPLLKIALKDKKIFSDKHHPARRLLNNTAKSSIGWREDGNNRHDKLESKIESIVNTILTKFDHDVQLFLDLNTEFNEFIAQQNKSSKAAEQRIVQANEGQEKLVVTQKEVDNAISQQLSPYEHLPKVVIALIEDGWKHVLKLRLLQKGRDSDEWRTSIALMQQLIWSVTPKSDASERKQLLAIIPGMLKSLREGLSGASFNQHKITALFKELQQCHVKCINGGSLTEEDLQNIEQLPKTVIPEIDLETLPALDAKEKVISDTIALQKAKHLAVGTWLEVSNDSDSTSKRIKFSWRSNLTGRCLFVTNQGAKTAEIAITELASWFQQGKILVIDQSTQLMDRALTSLMETAD